MKQLLDHMKFLCDDTRMLAGIHVAYGTASAHEHLLYGRAQEYAFDEQQRCIPMLRPLKEDSLFDLASLTKLFTSVMAMKLVEEGKLSLEETAGSIDPRFLHLKDVTIKDILSYRVNLQTPGRIDEAPDREEGLSRLFGVSPAPMPRIRLYSDINAMVIKYMIEKKTGLPYAKALRDAILRPAGMNDTHACVPESQLHRCVSYQGEHRIVQEKYVLRSQMKSGIAHDPKAALLSMGGEDLCGHAGLFSTEGDMVRFAQALLSGKLIARDTLLAIAQNQTGLDYKDGTHRQYLGYLVFTKHPNQYLSEVPAFMQAQSIGLSGFTGNHISIDPIQNCFVLFLGNRCNGRVSHITPPQGRSLQDYGLSNEGVGLVPWPDGRLVPSSARYVHFKDEYLHAPIAARMRQRDWL